MHQDHHNLAVITGWSLMKLSKEMTDWAFVLAIRVRVERHSSTTVQKHNRDLPTYQLVEIHA